MSVTELSLRVVFSFLALLILTRLMGRKELRQLTFFNFVSGIAIGSIAADLVANEEFSIRNGMLALAGWTVLTIVMGLFDIKSKSFRLLMEGQPVILIKNGEIIQKSLRQVRLDLQALKALLRQKNAFSMSEVEYAILETDGNLSVLKKENQQPATKQDTKSASNQSPSAFLATEVISDGKLNQQNIDKLHLEKDWILTQIQQNGLSRVSDVFYAELQKDGSLYVNEKEDVTRKAQAP
ncbi:DUF421 domain-containing protein [Salibacterium salarium]|uniref:DUF421 domain-containing protein n=1 Tax=Salibacterium salarium TaxID=284579 RepID=A0A3R9QJX3_9BACI|nr:DUF421 domain-containing protein [Salibacterium salarium]RSL32365.1 DUF421 domain-containing protein [Salibacterium salarium]